MFRSAACACKKVKKATKNKKGLLNKFMVDLVKNYDRLFRQGPAGALLPQ
jgi:hypothetical protein